jgi:hypothetical protein
VIAVGGAFELPAADDLGTVLTHQAANPALTDADTQLVQLLGHTRPAVAAQAHAVLVANMGQEHHIAPLAMRRGPVLPGMEPAL